MCSATMNKIPAFLFIFAVAVLLCVRPAHASGTVTATSVQNYTCWYQSTGVTYATNQSASVCLAGALSWAQQQSPSSNYSSCIFSGGTNQHIQCYYNPGSGQLLSGYIAAFNYGTTSYTCPSNSTGTAPSCTCTDPNIPNANATACLVPSFRGDASVVVCNASGCSSATYSTAAAACASYGSNSQTATLVSASVCKLVTTYSDGSVRTSYRTITNSNTCDSADSACLAVAASSASANNTAVSASNVAAAATLAASAAQTAATLAGASSSVAATQAQQAAAQVAADATRQMALPAAPTDYTRENTQLAIKADLDALVAQGASGVGAASSVPPDASQWGEVPAAGSVAVQNVTTSFTSMIFATSAGCPADIGFSMFGHSYSISFAPACSLMTTLRPLFLLLGAGTAAIILMGIF